MSVLAFDLGASSGRAVVGDLYNGNLQIEEVHRFSNEPVQVGNHLHWDILRLFYEIKRGLEKFKHLGSTELQSIGIDSWAVDFGLLDHNGELLGNPYHYRDHQTDGVMEKVFENASSHEIFSVTGIQFMPINTIYQLYAMKQDRAFLLNKARHLLMIPDLLRYFLTGERKNEWTNASTTQLFNTSTNQWDLTLLDKLGIPKYIFSDPVEPGTFVGSLCSTIVKELGISSTPVMAVAEHDTASAVAAVPSTESNGFAYLSCGTWSLLGTEMDKPVLSEQALQWNFTNEGGINHTYRLLKNIMGLWLLQECKRVWEKEGFSISYEEMTQMSEKSMAFRSFIDPDDAMFLNPSHMPQQIGQYCWQTKQPIPESKGEIIRCILESLALKYRFVLERTELLADKTFSGLHMVGGGVQNHMLCEFTANAIERPVWAGPTEATAIGNVMVQYIGLGEINSVLNGREIIKSSFPIKTYNPKNVDAWDQAYGRFLEFTLKGM